MLYDVLTIPDFLIPQVHPVATPVAVGELQAALQFAQRRGANRAEFPACCGKGNQ